MKSSSETKLRKSVESIYKVFNETLLKHLPYTLLVYILVGLNKPHMRAFFIGLLLSIAELSFAPNVDVRVTETKNVKEVTELTAQNNNSPKFENTETDLVIKNLKLYRYLGEQELKKIKRISKNLNIRETDLLKVIFLESGGNPKSRNPYTKATGLIQFIPQTASRLGTSVDSLYNMSALQQLDYVELYLSKNLKGNGRKSISELYLSIFSPESLYKPKNHVIAVKGDKRYNFNKNLDVNKNDTLTVADVHSYVAFKSKI